MRKLLNAILNIFWPIHEYVQEVIESIRVAPASWAFHRPTPSLIQVELSPWIFPGMFGAVALAGLGGVVELFASSVSDEPLNLNWRERRALRKALLDLAEFNDLAIVAEAAELQPAPRAAWPFPA